MSWPRPSSIRRAPISTPRESRLGYATITAPRDGVLITRSVERGTVVQPGKALLVLAPAGETQLVLQIDERNLGKLALGQKALASADAYPDQRFAAVVSYINPGVDITRASVEVKLDVADPPDYLRQDMTVSVDIEVAAKRQTRSCCRPARVHDVLSGQPWVLGIKDGRAVKQPVRSDCAATAMSRSSTGSPKARLAIPADSGVLTGQRVAADTAMNRWLPFEWIAAVRFLREGRLQTLFIIGGIAIGVGVIVFMSAMLAGLEANFIKRVLTSQPQIQLMAPDQVARPLRNGAGEFEDAPVQRPSQRVISIDQWPKIRDADAGDAGGDRGVADHFGLGAGHSRRRQPRHHAVGRRAGHLFQDRQGARLYRGGRAAADQRGHHHRHRTCQGPRRDRRRQAECPGGFRRQPRADDHRAWSISATRASTSATTYVALRTAQSLLGMIGGVTTIDMTVQDIYAAEEIAQRIQAANAVEADSWIKTNAQFFTAVQAQETSNTLIRLFVALSVAFGIAAVLIVSVIQRSKDIGILRAMGTSRGQILRVFLLQGGLLGFFGSCSAPPWGRAR